MAVRFIGSLTCYHIISSGVRTLWERHALLKALMEVAQQWQFISCSAACCFFRPLLPHRSWYSWRGTAWQPGGIWLDVRGLEVIPSMEWPSVMKQDLEHCRFSGKSLHLLPGHPGGKERNRKLISLCYETQPFYWLPLRVAFHGTISQNSGCKSYFRHF